MATYRTRKNQDGRLSHTATIRISVNGKSHSESKTHPDLKRLKRWVAKREEELRMPGMIDQLTHKGTTVGQVLAWYLKDFDGASKFGRSKLSHINFLLTLPIAELDAIHLDVSDLIYHAKSRDAGPSTINNDFVWLKNAMRDVRLSRKLPLSVQAVDDAMLLLRRAGIIGRSKERTRRPTIDEITQLLNYFKRQRKNIIPMPDVILFAMFSSRRQDEVTRIEWGDVDERRQGVLVKEMKHPKEKKDTFCHVPDRAWEVLQRQPQEGLRVFPYNGKSISSAFTNACKMLNIKDLVFHDLRHEAISCLFELHWDIPRVALVSGHKNWQSLQRYTQLVGPELFDKWRGFHFPAH